MATIFKYNGKHYQCMSLEKKLKRLKITKDDIEIILEGDLSQSELENKFLELNNTIKKDIEYEDPNRLYYFFNPKTGYSITSIHPVCNEHGYEPISKDDLESYWNKTRSV